MVCFSAVDGGTGPHDGGELLCGMTPAVPAHLTHGDPDWMIGLDQEEGQSMSPDMNQVPHRRYFEALAKFPVELRRR